MYELGEIYYEGKYGVKADLNTSVARYEKFLIAITVSQNHA